MNTDSTSIKVCIYSYNSRGFSDINQNLMKLLVSDSIAGGKIPILCNQENFQLRDNSYRLSKALPGFKLIIKPAVKKDLHYGRPSNGMFMAFPDSIKNKVTDVSPDFWRVQAAKIEFNTSTLLLLNSYFPTDPQNNYGDVNDLLETLSHIKTVLDKNPCDKVLWTGDINSDFNRHTNHTERVQDTVDELRLQQAWSRFDIDFTSTFEMLDQTFTAKLDHFFWSFNLDSCVEDAGVLHLPDNKSDHCPIYCTINMCAISESSTAPKQSKIRPSWKKSSSEQKSNYKAKLQEQLGQVSPPDSLRNCTDIHCSNPNHREELDTFIIELLETVQSVAEDTLDYPAKKSSNRATKSIRPGWKEEVKPFRDKAYFWHQIWRSCGSPINTTVHNIMKKTRNQYHYHYKKCVKAEEKIRSSKILSACFGEGGDLFQEIKQLRKCAPVVANSIDGVSENIPEHFASIYSELYNSADDADQLREVHKKVESLVEASQSDKVSMITPELVRKATERLKPGKSDPVYSFSTDCFKHGSDILYNHLADVLKSCTVHSHVPSTLLLSSLVPLVKDKLGNIHSSKNYRSVAISSIILKLIDWIIILLEGKCLGLSELQFAYQSNCSTVMCTWAALETIDYFLKNGSEVFTCATDMSKAVDMTLHSLMFHKMLNAGMTPVFVRLLIYIYANQMANVRWNGDSSATFTVRNGSGQGKVLAAIAYCLYCEELFSLLRRRRSGCWVLGKFQGLFGYSDDNWALAPSLSALQDILKTCEEYALSHNLKFSTDPNPKLCKTKCMAFLFKPRDLPSLHLCGNPLPWVDRLKHLGTMVSNQIDGCQVDIQMKRAKYIDRNNSIFQEFSFAHPSSKLKLNTIYNTHFSGSEVWKLFSPGITSFEGSFNKSIKIMCNLPYATHRYLVEPLSGGLGLRKQLIKKYLRFIQSIKNSSKPVIRQMLELCRKDTRTITGANLRNILLLTDLPTSDELNPSVEIKHNEIMQKDLWRVNVVKEILDMKFGELEVPEGWSFAELDEIAGFVCVS